MPLLRNIDYKFDPDRPDICSWCGRITNLYFYDRVRLNNLPHWVPICSEDAHRTVAVVINQMERSL